MKSTTHTPLWLHIGFWLSIAISVAVVVRRLVALAFPGTSGPQEIRAMDLRFALHPAVTLAHILGALAFVAATPFVVKVRAKVKLQDLWLALGLWTGLTGLAMTELSIGGWIERTAIYFFVVLLLFELWQAFQTRYEATGNQRWILRAAGLVLGIATTRPIVGFFFATSGATHLRPAQFFGIAFWIGFCINVIATEWWVRRSPLFAFHTKEQL